jgi:hypothetical protein
VSKYVNNRYGYRIKYLNSLEKKNFKVLNLLLLLTTVFITSRSPCSDICYISNYIIFYSFFSYTKKPLNYRSQAGYVNAIRDIYLLINKKQVGIWGKTVVFYMKGEVTGKFSERN